WTDVEQGDYTGTWNPRVDRGYVNWFGPSGHNVDFDGVFATLVFTVKETAAAGDYTVTVTYDEDNVFDQYDDNVAFDIQDGKVTVIAPEEAYYLIGTMTGWQVDENYKFTLNEDASVEEYILNVPDLADGAEIKVVKATGTATNAWYPDNADNYVVDTAHSGNVNVYFRPAGNSDWESFHTGGFFYISALHTVTVETDGNGTASIDPAAPDYTAEVTLTVTPNKGYVYAYTEIYDGNGEQIDLGSVQWNDTALTFNMPDYDIVVKVYFKEGPAFRSQSLMLQGRIGVRFFMSLPENDAFEYERVDFTISGKNADRAAATVEFSEDLPKNSKGYYGFTFYVNTIQMADTITATFYYLDNGVERTISKEYSVKSYLEWFDRTYSANPNAFAPEMANVIKALADLGHYMQAFLDETNNDWSVEEGDHAEMDKFFTTYTEADVADATAFVADHALSITGENSDIEGLQYALDLEREMAIRVFITVAEDFEGEFTATVDGKDAEVTKLTDTMYMVEVKDVQAHQLSREYTITIATAEGGTLTIVGSGLSYANLMFDTYSSNTLGEYAAVALYRYSKAADELKASAE
nr:hypothetical protein [Clostridiales bacterium]